MSDLTPSNPERYRSGANQGSGPTDDLLKQLQSLPPASPARALLLIQHQESLQKAAREACIEGFETTGTAGPAVNSSKLPIDLRIIRDIEQLRQSGGGDVVIYLPSFENAAGETLMGGSVTLPIFTNSDPQHLFRRAKEVANGDLYSIEVSQKVSDVEARYTNLLEGIPLERFENASALRVFANDGALSGVATQEEWIAAVTAYYALQPMDLFQLSEAQLRCAVRLSEDLLHDSQSQIQPIGGLAEFFLSRTPNYKPTWRAVMDERERGQMEQAAKMFNNLTGKSWRDISSATELLKLARETGQIEQTLVYYCSAIVPERGQLAYKNVLDPLLVSTISELNDHQLHSIALVIQKSQSRINRFFTLTIPQSPDLDEDNF